MKLMDRSLLLIVPLGLALPLVACAPGARGAPPRPAVSASLFEQHVARLSADEFQGRKPATAGERRTLEYLTNEFRRLGLVPGDGESYLQPVPVVEITAGSDARLAMHTPVGAEELRVPADAAIVTRRAVPEVKLEASPVVFVGYGVVAPEYGWNDYEGLDVRGKTALILINDPGFATGDESLFRGRALTYYGRWTYKFEEAARQGAAAALIVHETEPASYPWEVVVNGWSGPRLDKAAPEGAARLTIEGWITREAARRVLAAAGQDFEELKLRANRRGFRPLELPLTAEGALRNAIRTSTSANVVGVLKGSRRPRESVLYMAHWDHLGRSFAPGDNIFNGASDNATGVAGLLAIAEAFGRGRRPERSVVFLAVTLEESGLLGSAHYVDAPLLPLEHTAAVINMDNLYFGGPTRDVRVVGHGASELEQYLEAEARQQQRIILPEPTPEKGFFYRSDHFNFAKRGVPSLYIKLGTDDLECGEACGQRRQEEYFAQRYHKPADEYRPGDDLRGSAQDLELLYRVGLRLANERTFPNWYPDNEFRAIRDRSRAIAAQ